MLVLASFMREPGIGGFLLDFGKFPELSAEECQGLTLICVVALYLAHDDHVVTTLMMHNAFAFETGQTAIQ
jgi:hypothetical protein